MSAAANNNEKSSDCPLGTTPRIIAQIAGTADSDCIFAATGNGLGMITKDGRAARKMLKERRLREEFFKSDLFGEPAWDMLLDLFAASEEGKQVFTSSLCIAAAVPASTALRWINVLVDKGLAVREPDPRDLRRVKVEISSSAKTAVRSFIRRTEESSYS